MSRSRKGRGSLRLRKKGMRSKIPWKGRFGNVARFLAKSYKGAGGFLHVSEIEIQRGN